MQSLRDMGDPHSLATPWWYWIIAVIALLFAGMGLMQLRFISNLQDPWWAETGYAIGQIFNGAGAVGLLLRKSWARWLYVVSASGFIIQRVCLVFFGGVCFSLAD